MLKTKKLLAIALWLALGLVSATSFAADEKFSMKEVKVQNPTTVSVTFSKDLYAEGSNMFEFTLTQKDTKAAVEVKGLALSGTTQVVLTLGKELTMDKEYDLVAVFVSDKTGNVIENGVDGMLSFVPNTVLASASTTSAPASIDATSAAPTDAAPVDMNAAPTEAPIADLTATGTEPQDLNAAPADASVSASWATDSGALASAVATDANALPQTGPKEVLVVLLAMVLGLGVFVARRKA